MQPYPKRLIEVDLPIKRISAHARREKSIRHGHISTLHLWWARRPLAACRAVLCASLWPDPADPLCPQVFIDATAKEMRELAKHFSTTKAGMAELIADLRNDLRGSDLAKRKAAETESLRRCAEWQKHHQLADFSPLALRAMLLSVIAWGAGWEQSTMPTFLQPARRLTQAAHEALGGPPGSKPLVADPFAGGGSIPLEALRIGADAFASDLNPVAVLLNKVVLEYIPKYGQKLADEVRRWGAWIKEQAEKELGQFYPKDKDGAMPIAYLWARTIRCEGPCCGAEVPLIRSLWLAKRSGHSVALRVVPRPRAKRIDFEIIHEANAKEVGGGTVRRGSATCPCCHYTTPVASVRNQLVQQHGGSNSARLLAVVTAQEGLRGHSYRLPLESDIQAVEAARRKLHRKPGSSSGICDVPDEPLPPQGTLGFRVQLYGMRSWGDLFSHRQALALTVLAQLVRKAAEKIAAAHPNGLAQAVQSVLALTVDRVAVRCTANCIWDATTDCIMQVFNQGQALPARWEFAEMVPIASEGSGWQTSVEYACKVLDAQAMSCAIATVVRESATHCPLPDAAASAFVTDPPYYDAVPYSDLSDFFFVWLKRMLPAMAECGSLTPKEQECIVDDVKGKTKRHFEAAMAEAMSDGRRVLSPTGIGVVVFAHKSTSGWEAQLQAMIDAGLAITGSWPIDTESDNRLRAKNSAALASSVHLVCRPRQRPANARLNEATGDWRDVLAELPKRIHEWMPRLAKEGVVGADAIFACLGPALEIFSRYSRVEKASGEAVELREYLEAVWAAVAKEALAMIFEGADTRGFEEDARLTAIWFWVLKAANGNGNGNGHGAAKSAAGATADAGAGDAGDDDADDAPTVGKSAAGFTMEFDAARKLAQGLGADLSVLSRPGGILAISGGVATLLNIGQREQHLLGVQLRLDGGAEGVGRSRRGDKPAMAKLKAVSSRQAELWNPYPDPKIDPTQPFLPGMKPPKDGRTLIERLMDNGTTMLDRLHQAMLMFGRGHTSLMGPFLTESGMGGNERFWRLAQSLSALYPSTSEEKRWVDGLLARKKGMGF